MLNYKEKDDLAYRIYNHKEDVLKIIRQDKKRIKKEYEQLDLSPTHYLEKELPRIKALEKEIKSLTLKKIQSRNFEGILKIKLLRDLINKSDNASLKAELAEYFNKL